MEEARAAEVELLIAGEEPLSVPDEEWAVEQSTLDFLSAGPVAPQADLERRLRELHDQRLAQADDHVVGISTSTSAADVERRVAEALSMMDPGDEGARRIREAADERIAFIREQARAQTERREQEKRERGFQRLGDERSRPAAKVG